MAPPIQDLCEQRIPVDRRIGNQPDGREGIAFGHQTGQVAAPKDHAQRAQVHQPKKEVVRRRYQDRVAEDPAPQIRLIAEPIHTAIALAVVYWLHPVNKAAVAPMLPTKARQMALYGSMDRRLRGASVAGRRT